jgi:hypothetical protein
VINKYAVHCRSPRWWNRQASCQPVTPPSRSRLVAIKHCAVWRSPVKIHAERSAIRTRKPAAPISTDRPNAERIGSGGALWAAAIKPGPPVSQTGYAGSM